MCESYDEEDGYILGQTLRKNFQVACRVGLRAIKREQSYVLFLPCIIVREWVIG